MNSYRVRWEIDVEADSPREAAAEAFRLVRKPETTATVFDVTRRLGGPVTESWRVDLSDGYAKPLIEPAAPDPLRAAAQRALDFMTDPGEDEFSPESGRRCDQVTAQLRTALGDPPAKPDEGARLEAVDAARNLYASDEVEIEADAGISEADGGVWVQAWVWVPGGE